MTRHLRCVLVLAAAALAGSFLGCETNGWLIDPQRTGYFQTTPTSIPILDRIDVIEQARDTHIVRRKPNTEDLIPKVVEYRLSAGDTIRVTIPRLLGEGQPAQMEYPIGPAGTVNIPMTRTKDFTGVILAAGKTVTELEDEIKSRLPIVNATVNVTVIEAKAYQYRVLGSVEAPGLYGLNKPDLRLLDALATARGAAPTTTRVLVTRKPHASQSKYDLDYGASSSETSQPAPAGAAATAPQAGAGTAAAIPAGAPTKPAVTGISEHDIEGLVGQLDNETKPAPDAGGAKPPPAPAPDAGSSEPAPATPPAEPASKPDEPTRPATSPGMLSTSTRQEPPVDIDTLESAKAKDQASTQPAAAPMEGDRFTFDAASQSWVKVGKGSAGETSAAATEEAVPAKSAAAAPNGQANAGLRTGKAASRASKNDTKKAFDSEVIEIDYNSLVRGDANLNVVIRPGDMIFCDQGDVGVVYIDGLIGRPGVYNLPTSGKLTLSRLVAAAGGLGELAIPQRVDLVRRLGEDKEACIRVNLAAIRNRAEPDIFMKPDDHVHIGTNFWATPLAVIRNGFRMTYGFGFLVDRNWGNDIFGPPPTNVLGQ